MIRGIKAVLISCLEEWKGVDAFNLILHLVSRVSSRVFVGDDLCRNMTWLSASRGDYSLPV